jgi:2-polyprenyl-3-methyl-5-hydroxy-6-metoxy-1,4-benzoquinol methylase
MVSTCKRVVEMGSARPELGKSEAVTRGNIGGAGSSAEPGGPAMGAATAKLAEADGANHSRWEFKDRKALLYALVGNDFGPDPETKLHEIREYKKNEARFLLDALKPTTKDRVIDLGSGFGFIARVMAPLVERLWCLDISGEFLECAQNELREFANIEFQQMEFADLRFLIGQRITKGYANAVFIHFNFFDITLYLRQLFAILEPGGLFVFGMSDTDSLDIASDRYFAVVLASYKENHRSPVLMHWNSAKAVCRAAETIGFRAKNAFSGGGSAMILLEKPENAAAEGQAPADELTRAFCNVRNTRAALISQARNLCIRYPTDRDARYLLAESLHGAGMDDLAAAEYEILLQECPANERMRAEQGLAQSRADRTYFPGAFAKRLSMNEYSAGNNAAVWREYAWREIQRGREIVRMVRQVTELRGKRVLDVGSGYGGMLISMAEQGANVTGIEIDVERARIAQMRLKELKMEVPYIEGDICKPGIADEIGKFDVVICQDVLEHVMEPGVVIAALCKMMKPGGVIYIQIPNKYGVDQLMKDHHYALTGLTALSRPQAIEYWQLATGEAAEHYGVGYERGEKFYSSAFARDGVRLNPVDRYDSVEHVLWYAPAVSEMCTRLEKPIFPGLRPELEKRIRRRMTKVAQLYAHASQHIIELQSTKEMAAAACDAVVRRLCLGLWRFIGIKTTDRRAA